MKGQIKIITFLLVIYSTIIIGASSDCQNDNEELNLKFEIQNDQNQDQQSEERFVAVHVDQMGVDQLSPQIPEIQNIVRPFLPLNHNFLRALKATREIVNGLKYVIIFVMENERGEEIYCEMDVLEKPWLIRDKLKFRKMTYNNCSLSNPVDDDDKIRFQYEINPIFVNERTEVSQVDLRKMEDQIIVIQPETSTKIPTTSEKADDEDEQTLPPLNPASKNLLDDFFNMNNFFPSLQPPSTTTTPLPPMTNDTMNVLDEIFGIRKIEKSNAERKVINDESTSEDESSQQQENVSEPDKHLINSTNVDLSQLEVKIKKAFSELFQSDPDFQRNIITIINSPKDDLNAQKNYNQVISVLVMKIKDSFVFERRDDDAQLQVTVDPQLQVTVDPLSRRRRRSYENRIHDVLSKLDQIDVDDRKRILIDVLSVKGVQDSKNIIRVEATVAESRCQENSQEVSECAEKIDWDSMKLCFLKINENNGELSESQCAPLNREKRQGIPGGVNNLDVNDEDVKLFLKEALDEINAGEDPDYSVKEVLEASTQVVAGQLVKFRAALLVGGQDVTCNFEIWEQAWLPQGRDVKVICDNQRLYKLTQVPVNQRNKIRKTRDVLVGGATEVSKEDEESVLNLLNENLARLDTGSDEPLKLVSHEKITRQVVSGLKYKIKGNFKAGEDEARTCTIEIWTRPWIKTEDGTQIKAECEDGLRLKSKRTKRSARPMPGRHEKFLHSKETSDLKAREMKSEVLFENFVKKYHRRYVNDLEHKMRHRIFKKNLHKIDMLNKHEQGTAKYGITPFADYTEKEYLHKTGLVVRENGNELQNPIAEIPDIQDLPEEFDWTEKGAVTSVKNQGNCGSCWSFSVTGNIEGLHAIKTGKLEAYSEQELLDCDTQDNACNGGYMDDAFKAIEKIGGLELEDEYPYKAKKQKKCLFNSTMSHVKVKGVVDMPKGDELAIQKYLVANGPISIGINAAAMQFYRGGVSHPWKILCRKSDLDHGVLLVGYGIKNYPLFNKTLPYWKIKNSWGPKWGEQGYYRIYRGDNSCGVAEMASSAVLDD